MGIAALTLGFAVGTAVMGLFWRYYNKSRDLEREALIDAVKRHDEMLKRHEAMIEQNYREIKDGLQSIMLSIGALAGREQCIQRHTDVNDEITDLKVRVSVLEKGA